MTPGRVTSTRRATPPVDGFGPLRSAELCRRGGPTVPELVEGRDVRVVLAGGWVRGCRTVAGSSSDIERPRQPSTRASRRGRDGHRGRSKLTSHPPPPGPRSKTRARFTFRAHHAFGPLSGCRVFRVTAWAQRNSGHYRTRFIAERALTAVDPSSPTAD